MMGCLSLFRKQNLKWLGVLATIIMTFVQLGGALVTKTGSEDGCGSSWPFVMALYFQKIYQYKQL